LAKLAWTVPATEVSLTLFLVVDPDQSLADTSRSDNVLSLTTALPDLVVSNVDPEGRHAGRPPAGACFLFKNNEKLKKKGGR